MLIDGQVVKNCFFKGFVVLLGASLSLGYEILVNPVESGMTPLDQVLKVLNARGLVLN